MGELHISKENLGRSSSNKDLKQSGSLAQAHGTIGTCPQSFSQCVCSLNPYLTLHHYLRERRNNARNDNIIKSPQCTERNNTNFSILYISVTVQSIPSFGYVNLYFEIPN